MPNHVQREAVFGIEFKRMGDEASTHQANF